LAYHHRHHREADGRCQDEQRPVAFDDRQSEDLLHQPRRPRKQRSDRSPKHCYERQGAESCGALAVENR